MSKYRPEQDWPRYIPVNKILVSVYDRTMGQAYGEVSNISAEGACISADRHFEPDSTVLLRINFPNQPDAFVTQAEVVWSREVSNGGLPYGHGVTFCFAEEEQRAALDTILDSPDFKRACPEQPDEERSSGFDKFMSDLTDVLDKLGKTCHRMMGDKD